MKEICLRFWDRADKKLRYVNLHDYVSRHISYNGDFDHHFEHACENNLVMLCSDVFDYNGKQIYEGDIIHIYGGEYCQGFYEIDKKITINDLNELYVEVYFAKEYRCKIVVIGNKYN